ncbi:MAG: hypothetical protein QOK42_657 [Frankiaceae bacterium]|jgi:cytochrome c-type biogenesis protein CcmH/NrfF|nr:hypothetical protein [Frankiaceae bacterium]MDX6225139.1 hypothetical protein [Frankiales bacterium]MDX6272803.1 hypothetical protein [Frankiales bacterium]
MWQTLMWTGAPVVALLLGIVWAHWRSRDRGPVETMASVEEYERFRAAIQKPSAVVVPAQRGERPDPKRAKAS